MTDRPEHLLPDHLKWPSKLQDIAQLGTVNATPFERDALKLLKSIDERLSLIQNYLHEEPE